MPGSLRQGPPEPAQRDLSAQDCLSWAEAWRGAHWKGDRKEKEECSRPGNGSHRASRGQGCGVSMDLNQAQSHCCMETWASVASPQALLTLLTPPELLNLAHFAPTPGTLVNTGAMFTCQTGELASSAQSPGSLLSTPHRGTAHSREPAHPVSITPRLSSPVL